MILVLSWVASDASNICCTSLRGSTCSTCTCLFHESCRLRVLRHFTAPGSGTTACCAIPILIKSSAGLCCWWPVSGCFLYIGCFPVQPYLGCCCVEALKQYGLRNCITAAAVSLQGLLQPLKGAAVSNFVGDAASIMYAADMPTCNQM